MILDRISDEKHQIKIKSDTTFQEKEFVEELNNSFLESALFYFLNSCNFE